MSRPGAGRSGACKGRKCPEGPPEQLGGHSSYPSRGTAGHVERGGRFLKDQVQALWGTPAGTGSRWADPRGRRGRGSVAGDRGFTEGETGLKRGGPVHRGHFPHQTSVAADQLQPPRP